MSEQSRQVSYNVQYTIGKTVSALGTFTGGITGATTSTTYSGDFEATIDNFWYDTRSRLYNGHRPVRMETLSFTTTDDMGNNVTQTYETPDLDENGNQIIEPWTQCDDGYDEKYFYHMWDWQVEDLNSSLQRTISRNVRAIKVSTSSSTETWSADTSSGSSGVSSSTTSTITGQEVTSAVSWTITLDKVDSVISGSVPSNIVNLYHGGTSDNKIFFKYTTDTDVLLKVGDTLNGATITKVWHPHVHVEGSERNVIKSNTVCYAEITGGSNFIADGYYDINSPSGGTITSNVVTSTVTHHFNDITDVTQSILVSNAITATGNVTVIPQAENDPGGGDSSSSRKHYLIQFGTGVNLSSANDVTITVLRNMTAFGTELASAPVVSKRELVNSNTVKIWFKRTDYNTDNSYVRSWSISATESLSSGQASGHIQVVAGKGIKQRSVAVGTYIQRDAKELKLSPVFYRNELTGTCIQDTLDDNNAVYLLGTTELSDGSKLFEDDWILKSPKTTKTKMFYNVLLSNFKYSPRKSEVETWLSLTNLTDSQLRDRIIEDVRSTLNGKTVSIQTDNCRNGLIASTSGNFDPYSSIQTGQQNISALNSFAEVCNTPLSPNQNPVTGQITSPPITSEQLAQNITDLIQNSNNNPAFALPEHMYEQFVSGENSLLNRLSTALRNVEDTFSDMTVVTVNNDIHIADGDNQSTADLTRYSWRDVPQSFPKIDMILEDVIIDDSKIDIVNANNIFGFTIKSIPRFLAPDTITDTNFDIAVNKDSNGYLTTVVATVKEQNTTTTGNPFLDLITGITTTNNSSVEWHGPGGTAKDQGKVAHTIWKHDEQSVQLSYLKEFRYRTEELSEHVKKYTTYRGNPYITEPIYARITSTIGASDTTINVNTTDGFFSSGYLIIPKFVKKIELYGTSNNERVYYYYDGEEIIYYSGKTATSFTGCQRARYGTTTSFHTSLTPFERSPDHNAVTTGYSEGESISQYHPYKPE